MDPEVLSSAAKSYDFAEGFIRPSAAEMSGGAPNVPNFGVHLSTILGQRFAVKWSQKKFDPVGYVLHLLLGTVFSMQHSDEMRAAFHIDKVFWTVEKDDKLKMYITTRGESENKLMMKCLTFGNGKPHDWSQKDFLDVVSKLGPGIESYKIESHHYNAQFKEEILASDGRKFDRDGFFITADYLKSIKIDPSLIQKGEKTSSKHFKEIKPLEGEAVDIERFFRGMLTEPERADFVRTSAKDFSNHVVENFRNNFKATLPEAQFGFMHGNFLPFQRKYDFLAHPAHVVNDERPTAQFSIYLQKQFTESWKRLTPDYPVVFHIVDSESGGSRKKIENRISEVMTEQSDAPAISLPDEPLASEALVNYVNFNAKENTIVQKDFPTQPMELLRDFRKQLTEIAPSLPVKNDGENYKKRMDMEKKIKLAMEKGILSNRLRKKGMMLEKSGKLLAYLHGFFSSGGQKAYIVEHKYQWVNTRRPQTRFLFETDNKEIQVMLCVHETEERGDVTRMMLMNDEALIKEAPALNEDSKFLSIINVIVPYTKDTLLFGIPDTNVISYTIAVNWNEKFNFDPILPLHLASETSSLTERGES
uniref:Uncharacterized protein n=1 Tax=Romanomermis culicivorax TaxID=13658 RepID=A0A915KAD4_ROMCU